MVSCGNDGLVVVHVGRRLLVGMMPRQFAMPRHHNNVPCLAEKTSKCVSKKRRFFEDFVFLSVVQNLL